MPDALSVVTFELDREALPIQQHRRDPGDATRRAILGEHEVTGDQVAHRGPPGRGRDRRVSASGAPSWPPLKGTTLLLWFGPGLLFVAGLLALALSLRRRDRAIKDAPLTADEQRRAEALLQDQDSRQGQP